MSDTAKIAPRVIVVTTDQIRAWRNAGHTTVAFVWFGAALAAFWGAIPQVWDRWFEPWGSVWSCAIFLFAAGAWLLLTLAPNEDRVRFVPHLGWLAASVAFLALYFLSWNRAPQLVTCELAAAGIGCMMVGTVQARLRTGAFGIFVLMLLCVHVATSLDFFIGFPLRLVSSKFAALLLGPNASSVGTALTDGHTLFYVDAPCSGVRMLTASIALGAALAALYQLRWMHTIALVSASIFVAVFGNAQRAAALFISGFDPYEEAHEMAHEIVGVIVFIECAALMLGIAAWINAKSSRRAIMSERKPAGTTGRVLTAAFLTLLPVGIGLPVMNSNSTPQPVEQQSEVQWPTTWNGNALTVAPLPANTEAFVRTIPGAWQQFRIGTSESYVLLRRTMHATRELHSAENCYRAMGGTCSPMPSFRDEQGHIWSRFRYDGRDGSTRYVRECYFSIPSTPKDPDLSQWIAGRQSWPDVSAWFWAATVSSRDVGTTLAVTVSEPTYRRQ